MKDNDHILLENAYERIFLKENAESQYPILYKKLYNIFYQINKNIISYFSIKSITIGDKTLDFEEIKKINSDPKILESITKELLNLYIQNDFILPFDNIKLENVHKPDNSSNKTWDELYKNALTLQLSEPYGDFTYIITDQSKKGIRMHLEELYYMDKKISQPESFKGQRTAPSFYKYFDNLNESTNSPYTRFLYALYPIVEMENSLYNFYIKAFGNILPDYFEPGNKNLFASADITPYEVKMLQNMFGNSDYGKNLYEEYSQNLSKIFKYDIAIPIWKMFKTLENGSRDYSNLIKALTRSSEYKEEEDIF